jgi:HAD superfamily hydrolase (TIGR01509 family)
MAFEAVIFDLDGVIVDSHPAHKHAWKALLRSFGIEVPDTELAFVLEGQTREDILRHFLGDLTPGQVQRYGARKDAILKESSLELNTINGLPEFIAQVEAAGLAIALGSSASRRRVKDTLERLDLKRCFDVMVTGDDVVKGKPDPAIFCHAARGMGVAPENILVCEDAVAGVEAAKAVGMKCLAIAADGRSHILQRAGADRVVPDFTSVSVEDLRRLFGQF